MIDLVIFLAVIGFGGLFMYKALKASMKVVFWAVTLALAYVIIKFAVL
ncbi:MAG: hypothetical protein ABIG20_03655 [archaeon]